MLLVCDVQRKVRNLERFIGAFFVLVGAAAAEAQWSPLDLIPPANLVIGFDTSHSVNISVYDPTAPQTDCGGFYCHHDPAVSFRRNPTVPFEETRTAISRNNLLNVMGEFSQYFVFGGFRYSSCDYVKIEGRVSPNATDPNQSFAAMTDLLSGITSPCNVEERRLPPEISGRTTLSKAELLGNGGGPTDRAKFWPLLAGTATITGLKLPNFNVDVTCSSGANFNPARFIESRWWAGMPALGWNNYNSGGLNASRMQRDFCFPLQTIFEETRDRLVSCGAPSAIDFSFLDGPTYEWCQRRRMADNMCNAGEWAANTCLCSSWYDRDVTPQCWFGDSTPQSMCGVEPEFFHFRQQFAMCAASYDGPGATPADSFLQAFKAQPDNRVNRFSDPTACRENAVVYFTDGLWGDYIPGPEIYNTRMRDAYVAPGGEVNVFVANVSEAFTGAANRMSRDITRGVRDKALNALTEEDTTRVFIDILNRTQRGVYANAAFGLDADATRAAFYSYTIPRNYPGEPELPYLGRPSRISWHEISPEGELSDEPLWETDWSGLAGSIGSGDAHTNPIRYLCPGADTIEERAPTSGSPCGAQDRQLFGPLGTFWDGTYRRVTVPENSIDRDGDATVDPHPELRWGFLFGATATHPLVIGAPKAFSTQFEPGFSEYTTSDAVRLRPRVIYMQGNGYLHALHAGEPAGSAMFGLRRLAQSYDDSPEDTEAGREIFRYRPPWLETVNNWAQNPLIERPLLNGQLVVREMPLYEKGTPGITTDADTYATVLVMNQGADGRGYAALDVTNPYEPRVIAERTLPVEEFAIGTPVLHAWPDGAGGSRPMVLFTSGTTKLWLWDLRADDLHSIDLSTRSEVYSIEPTCIADPGSSMVSRCYVLGRFGTIWRLEVAPGDLVSPVDITPTDLAVRGAGREYWTRPAVYFDADNFVRLAFGSGGPGKLVRRPGDSAENRIFVLRDPVRDVPSSTRLTGQGVCVASGGSTAGSIDIERRLVLSTPVVRKGGVFFTAYRPADAYCKEGHSALYAFNYNDCSDLASPALRPAPITIGTGLPLMPRILPQSGKVLTQTAEKPAATSIRVQEVTLAGGRRMAFRKLFWREISGVR